MISNSEISFYVDSLMAETLLSDNTLTKQAQGGLISGLKDKIVHYVSNHIDPNNKAGSLLNILAPGVVTVALNAMGLGKIGFLFGLAMDFFHINVSGIFSTIYEKIKGILGGGKQMTSADVDGIVHSAVIDHAPPGTEEEAAQAETKVKSKTQAASLRDAKLVKLAMAEYEKVSMKIKKEPLKKEALLKEFLSFFIGGKARTAGVLAKVLGFIFKVFIASAGLMVAGDVANSVLGRPSALNNTIQNGKPVEQVHTPLVVSTQTKFKLNPSYKNEVKNTGGSLWTEDISNDSNSITSMLVMFAKQVYSGLDGLENTIKGTGGFQVIRDKIVSYNKSAAGDPVVYIPKTLTSKKEIVDTFIDDVAERAPK